MQDSKEPLTARSVLASALLGEDPPELPVAHLVHLAGLFGISGNRARVALSRMVAAGEASTDGNGRYRLAGHLLDRLGRQAGSRRGETGPWEGAWRLVVVTTSAPSGRAPDQRLARRKRLALARLAEQREGVWLRPDNIELVPDPGDDPHLTVFTATPDADPAALASALWDLEGWTRRARGPARPDGPAPAHRSGRPGPGLRTVRRRAPPSAGRPTPPGRAAARRMARGDVARQPTNAGIGGIGRS